MPALLRLALTLLATATALLAAPDADAIRTRRAEQNAAIARLDFSRVAEFWTEDVSIRRGLGSQSVGREEYLKSFQATAGSAQPIVFQRLPDSVEVSTRWPLAFETGRWEGHQGTLAGPVIISGRYSAQWVKRGDTWLIRGELYVALDGAGVGLAMPAVP